MTQIKWVDGYEGHYAVTDDGRVISYKTGEPVFLTLRLKKTGYIQVSLSLKGKAKEHSVHQLVAKAFIDNPNNYTEVNHKDGKKRNNKKVNLEWCSRSENLKHAYATGLRNPEDYLNHDKTQHTFVHPVLGQIICTAHHLYTNYGKKNSKSHLYKVIKGQFKSWYGWQVVR